jgi:hypothetical protein
VRAKVYLVRDLFYGDTVLEIVEGVAVDIVNFIGVGEVIRFGESTA